MFTSLNINKLFVKNKSPKANLCFGAFIKLIQPLLF